MRWHQWYCVDWNYAIFLKFDTQLTAFPCIRSSCYDELLAFSLGLKLVHFHQVNTQAPSNVIDCSDRNNSKYYVVVVQVFLSVCLSVCLCLSLSNSLRICCLTWLNYLVWTFSLLQYTARFNAETVKNFLYLLNNSQIAKKKFNCKLS